MDVREKLVELLCDGTAKTETCDLHKDCVTAKGDCGFCTIMADHLIANGVTVQEWISVKDRLPDEDETVLVWLGNNRRTDLRKSTDSVHEGIWWRWGAWVTHWAPLNMPEPAKDNNVPTKWIPVTERLPEGECRCLVLDAAGDIEIDCYDGKGRFVLDRSGAVQHPSHWMPLPKMPQPPKGE